MNKEEYSKYIDNIKDMSKEELQDYILQYFETLKVHYRMEDKLQEQLDKYKIVLDKIKKYIKETKESDSYTTLPSGKITDIEYCLVALEDIEDLLNGKELKGE